MDLFDLLIILFIMLPLLEGVLKRGKGSGPAPGPGDEQGEESDEPAWSDDASAGVPGQLPRSGRDEEPASAADMVPDDLWAVLTGESPQGRTRSEEPTPTRAEPESAEPATAREPDGVDSRADSEPSRFEPAARAPSSRSRERRSTTIKGPELDRSLEYTGPEAYSLERTDYRPVSLERPLRSAEARHRAFHGRIDRPPRRRTRRRSALARALADPEGLRQAIVLSEVLAPPKGLDP